MSITALPNELIAQILTRVPGSDAGQCARVSKLFNNFYDDPYVWKYLCKFELGFEVPLGNAKETYQHCFYHYGALQGLFLRCTVPGGGLLLVCYRNQCLVGLDIQVSKFGSFNKDHIETEMFRIKIDRTNLSTYSRKKVIKGVCTFGKSSVHACQITARRPNKKRKLSCNKPVKVHPGFSILCKKPLEHSYSQYEAFLRPQSKDYLDTNYKAIEKYQQCFKFSLDYDVIVPQRSLPSLAGVDMRDVPLESGVFKGDFIQSRNGVQLVNLSYQMIEGVPYLICTKITGDDHIKPGLIALRSKMEFINVLDWDFTERPSIEEVKDKKPLIYIELEDLKNRAQQYFTPPVGCQCILPEGRITGKCCVILSGEMVVNDGHKDWVNWCEGYCVIFNQDLWGFLNLRRNFFHVFERIKL